MIKVRPLISIIVPIFNQEKNLYRCLDSLLSQTAKNIEIILIDDGSKDKSREICEEYLLKDKRFKLIIKENGGLSDARNAGIKGACGKYYMFVDSDDFIITNACNILEELIIEYNPDIISFEYFEIKEKDIYNIKDIIIEKKIKKLSGFEAGRQYIYGKYINNSIWSKIFRRELFKEIDFPIGLYAEDMAITYKLLAQANTVIYTNQKLYCYIRYGSGTIMSNNSIKLILDTCNIHSEKYTFEFERYPDDSKIIETSYTNRLLKTLARLINENNYKYSELIKLYEKKILSRNFKLLKFSTLIFLVLFIINKKIFASIMKILGFNG